MDPFQEIRLGHESELRNAISDEDIVTLNEHRQNLLHEAVAYKRLEIGKELIRRGIFVNHQDDEGGTPLHYAAAHRDPIFTKVLLENGANPNIHDQYGNGPLWAAVFNAKGFYDVVALLMDAGANPNHRNKHDRSPLDFAQQIKDNQLVAILQSGFKTG